MTEEKPLEQRLEEGLELLTAMERGGKTNTTAYQRYLGHFVDLLARYELEEDRKMREAS